MPSVQVKTVPEGVHAELRRRAARAGQSLQEYLLARLVDAVRRPDVGEVLARAGERSGGSVPLSFARGVVRRNRESR